MGTVPIGTEIGQEILDLACAAVKCLFSPAFELDSGSRYMLLLANVGLDRRRVMTLWTIVGPMLSNK
jgi:hypothetical protein